MLKDKTGVTCYVLLLIILALSTIFCEEDFDDSKVICSQCKCTKRNQSFTINCTSKGVQHVLNEWPNDGEYEELIAIFSYSNINRLERLAASKAHVLKVVYSHCGIKELDSGIVTAAVNVTYLDLSYNSITSEQLHSDVFKGPFNESNYEPLTSLKHLNLAYNEIHSLNKRLFEHVPYLEELNLEGNGFKVIDVHTAVAFGDVPRLKYLNLANNGLVELLPKVVKPMKNLKILDLSNNRFDFVPDAIGCVGDSLQVLIVDGNPIIELSGNTFMGNKKLTHISANNLSKLKRVMANTFAHLDKLSLLKMSNNPKLDRIDDEAFGQIQNLKELQLSNNNLSTLHPHMINWAEIKTLNISNNPFVCNCDLYNVTVSLSEKIIRNREDIPTCWDYRKPNLIELFELGGDICTSEQLLLQRSSGDYFTDFRILRMSIITCAIVLMVVVFATTFLFYTKWKAYKRCRSYPFASQVVYNPITTNMLH